MLRFLADFKDLLPGMESRTATVGSHPVILRSAAVKDVKGGGTRREFAWLLMAHRTIQNGSFGWL